ncbi:MAG: DUF1285 domain-containing protein, partial [Pseudomonadota bacterium]
YCNRRGMTLFHFTQFLLAVGDPYDRHAAEYLLPLVDSDLNGRITVDDAPFVAVDFRVETGETGPVLVFITNVGDETAAGAENPIRVALDPETGEPAPYVHVRRGLEALIDRKSFYRLAEIGEVRETGGEAWFGLVSAGRFFPIQRAAELEA